MLRRFSIVLVIVALVLPIAALILLAAARLLAGMGDDDGAAALDRLVLAAGLLWAIDLAVLVIVQALDSLGPPPRPPARHQPDE